MTTYTPGRPGAAAPEATGNGISALECTRERSDTYAGEFLRSGDYRVAICPLGMQWLLQRRRKVPIEGATATWDSVAFCTTRAALLRLWRALTGENGSDLLALLPECIRREVAHGAEA